MHVCTLEVSSLIFQSNNHIAISLIDEQCYPGLEWVVEIELIIICDTEPSRQEELSSVLATYKPQSLCLREPHCDSHLQRTVVILNSKTTAKGAFIETGQPNKNIDLKKILKLFSPMFPDCLVPF